MRWHGALDLHVSALRAVHVCRCFGAELLTVFDDVLVARFSDTLTFEAIFAEESLPKD